MAVFFVQQNVKMDLKFSPCNCKLEYNGIIVLFSILMLPIENLKLLFVLHIVYMHAICMFI